MIDGLNEILSQQHSLNDLRSRNDKQIIILLANKIEELERRIDKMESQRLIDDFERMQKEKLESHI